MEASILSLWPLIHLAAISLKLLLTWSSTTTPIWIWSWLLTAILWFLEPVSNQCADSVNQILTFLYCSTIVIFPVLWNSYRLQETKSPYSNLYQLLSQVWSTLMIFRLVPFGGMNYMESNVGPSICTTSHHQSLYPMMPFRSWHGWEPNWFTGLFLIVSSVFVEEKYQSVKMSIWLCLILVQKFMHPWSFYFGLLRLSGLVKTFTSIYHILVN